MFVNNYVHMYGKKFVVYCVHSLLHITDDVRLLKTPLDDFSGFMFENYLQTLKKYVKSPSIPIIQVAKRIEEYESCCSESRTCTEIGKH